MDGNYITRENALQVVCTVCECACYEDEGRECPYKKEVMSIPPADVQPVVRGQYIIDDMGDPRCSVCGETELNVTKDFCPGCGARLTRKESVQDGRGAQ